MSGKRRQSAVGFSPIMLEQMQRASEDDPLAVSVLAATLARDWCEKWGGIPEDRLEWMKHVYCCRFQAKRDLAIIMRLPLSERITLAHYIRSRLVIPPFPPLRGAP